MDQSQSLNAPPFFDGSNYVFWKVHIRAFLCAIDESVRAALALANANSKAINAIFCGVSPDEFHRSLMSQWPRRHGKSWRQPMKAPKR